MGALSTFTNLRRGPLERIAAWLVTGPLGHLYGALADLTAFLARLLAGRAYRTLAGRGRR